MTPKTLDELAEEVRSACALVADLRVEEARLHVDYVAVTKQVRSGLALIDSAEQRLLEAARG